MINSLDKVTGFGMILFATLAIPANAQPGKTEENPVQQLPTSCRFNDLLFKSECAARPTGRQLRVCQYQCGAGQLWVILPNTCKEKGPC
jgi:hypothetical protein